MIEILKKKQPKIILGLLVFSLVGTFILTRIFAASASVSLESNVSSVSKNQTFDVKVNASAGDTPVAIAQAYIKFDPSKVQYVSFDSSRSPLNTDSPEFKIGDGYVNIGRFQTPPGPYPSGNFEVATITFKALAESGTIDLTLEKAGQFDKTSLVSAEDASNIVSATNSITIAISPETNPPPGPMSVEASLLTDKDIIKEGDIVRVEYVIQSGDNDISIAKGHISFNPDQLEYVSTDYTNSSFSATLSTEEQSGNGFVSIARYTLESPYPKGAVNVGAVNLRAITDNAVSTISIDEAKSQVYVVNQASNITELATINGQNTTVNINTPNTNPYEPVCEDTSANNTGDPLPCTYDPEPVCEDVSANNTGNPLPCTYDPEPVCEDTSANNTGDPLPCTYDPDDPPPIVVPVNPGGGTTQPQVPRGTTVVPQAPSTTSTGQKVTNTDYYLNGQYRGSSTGIDDPVRINTENLEPGTYEITAKSTAEDGSTEESAQQFKVKDDAILVKYRLPIVLAVSSILAVIIGVILKTIFTSTVPFYRTLK
ncbi:hypothetical protein KC950_02365 [Candidatus Saccharibacteria bacterium]|nr:hypothetical protein [Candidatus Saccharibacteria bacterium]